METKDKLVSFRTSERNVEYLKKLAESDERSISFILNRMVDTFRTKRVKKVPSTKK